MCKPNTLHHNKHGYVSWCAECQHMSVAFGNLMMALAPAQLEGFIRILSIDADSYKGKICIGEKAFVYNSDSAHVKMVLNYKEVEQLLDLLNKAWLIHQVNELLFETDKE